MNIDIAAILSFWDMEFAGYCDGITVAGSREYADARRVVRVADGSRWIIDRFTADRKAGFDKSASALAHLADAGMQGVRPYAEGKYGRFYHDGQTYWALLPYAEGLVTERPLYAAQEWRGKALAAWLADLSRHGAAVAGRVGEDRFSYGEFLFDLEKKLRSHDAGVYERVERAFRFCDAALAPKLEEMPQAFAHGDLHALNVIWGDARISAVIDWEFCGMRPQGYDAALMLGCIAMEDPALIGDACAVRMMHDLRKAGVYAPATFAAMPALIVASRLAWLSDWLHRGIDEMVEAECTLLNILLNNIPVLEEICAG